MAKEDQDKFSEKEAKARFEAALRGGLNTHFPLLCKSVGTTLSRSPVFDESRFGFLGRIVLRPPPQEAPGLKFEVSLS
jgi:hypothetical protein